MNKARYVRALSLRSGLDYAAGRLTGKSGAGIAMDPKKQKEEFQYAYVAALAAHAGLNRGDFRVDDDSVDIIFQGKGYPRPYSRPQIQLQLKCSSQDLISGGMIKYPLKRKNYDDLRGDDVVVPRYLALLVVPEKVTDWVLHHGDCVALHNLCYWVSLRDKPASSNTTTVTIDVPLSQRLTTDVLRSMMTAASQGRSM